MLETLRELTERIREAPFEQDSWPSILEQLASLAGGWGGQLIGVDDGGLPFFITGGIPPELVEEFTQRGAGDPANNPRLPALVQAPMMSVVTDAELVPELERRRSPLYREFFEPREGHYVSMAMLSRAPDPTIVAAVNHTLRQGVPDAEARARFQALLPHLKAAMHLQMKLEDQGAAIALGILETLGIAAILCDWAGGIVACSAQAEQLLSRGDLVTQRKNRLHAVSARCDAKLHAAMDRALLIENLYAPKTSSVVLVSADGADAKVAEICPLPSSATSLRLGARVLVIVGGPRRQGATALLVELGLTESEAEVARGIYNALTPQGIAQQRGVALDTVRTQIKAVYAKLGVRRQPELIERLRDLL
ncbi:MAG: helix-turn-helix transcriptional regulator [Vitreimonas sp.]